MVMSKTSDLRYRNILVTIYICVWIISAINPHYFADWLLENVLVFGAFLIFVLTAHKACLSKLSNTFIFVFLCLHSVGAHYTYSLVPYDEWINAVTGINFNQLVGWERNNFDRTVHFSFGLLLTYPIREVLLRFASLGPTAWSYLLPFLIIFTASASFELIEWLAAVVFGGDLGQAYLGTQGDEWDSHKDTALAALGSLISMVTVFIAQVLCSNDRQEKIKTVKSFKFD
jgi:putative membrane protein